jgi:hypothetical protein
MHNKVDAKSIALEGTVASIQKLAKFVLCRQAVGRGGEHVFLRWPEAFWDDFYHASDSDWTIIKHKNTKCTLLFGVGHIYCLCPYFTIGAYMLMGGLCRDKYKEATGDKKYKATASFMFPAWPPCMGWRGRV